MYIYYKYIYIYIYIYIYTFFLSLRHTWSTSQYSCSAAQWRLICKNFLPALASKAVFKIP